MHVGTHTVHNCYFAWKKYTGLDVPMCVCVCVRVRVRVRVCHS